MKDIYVPSHRIKVEEKKIYRKLVMTLAVIIVSMFVFIRFGIPVFIKFVASFGNSGRETVNETAEQSDILPPLPPILNSMPEATSSGKIRISGYSAEDTKVVVLINGKKLSPVETDDDGLFLAKNISLEEGENIITAYAILNDRESSPSAPLVVRYLNSPPKLEIETPREDQQYLSEDSEIIIKGTTDKDNRVMINNRFAITDNQGGFEYKIKLENGENVFTLKAIDPAGNETEIERKVRYIP